MWTARLLEHDLAAGGRTVEAALDTLVKIVQAHVAFDLRHGREPLSAFAPAPLLYRSAFARATRLDVSMQVEWYESTSTPVFAATVPEHPILTRWPPASRIA